MSDELKITEPKIDERNAQPYLGIRTQVHHSEFPTIIPQYVDEVFTWLAQNGVAPDGPPFMRYHVIDMPGLMDVDIGVPVASAVAGDERVKPGTLPAGRYASLIYTDVTLGIPSNGALLDWIKQQGYAPDAHTIQEGDAFAARYESFLTGPEDDPDPANWDTEVAIKLAD